MRRKLLALLLGVTALVGLWGTAVVTQSVQCGGSFVPSLNCTVSGFWNFTKTNGLTPSLPTPFQVAGVTATGVTSYTTNLSNAQILALGATPITVVPAPGPGKYIEVIGVTVYFDYTGAYTGGSNLQLWYTSRQTGPAASSAMTSSVLTGTQDAAVHATGTPDTTTDLDLAINAPVVIQPVGATFGGGNASNAVRVVVNYRVVHLIGTVN